MLKVLKILLAVLLASLAFAPATAQVLINEIMYDPAQSDYYNEWIEILNSGNSSADLTNWTLCGDLLEPGYVNHTDSELYSNEGLQLAAGQYAVITDGGSGTDVYGNFNVSQDALALHVSASSLCGGLANAGGTLYLNQSNGSAVDTATYEPLCSEGQSLQLINGSWVPANPTPGFANALNESQGDQSNGTNSSLNVVLTVYLEQALVGMEYTKLFKIQIENKDDCSAKDLVFVEYNISMNGTLILAGNFSRELGCSATADTGSWSPNEVGNFTLCGLIVNSTLNETNLEDNQVCGNVSVRPGPLTILEIPTSSSFGSLEQIFIKFETNEYPFDRAKFLVYGHGEKVVADLEGNKIKRYSTCQASTATEINTSINSTYYLYIPFFLYPNCDSAYSDRQYSLAMQVCRPTSSNFTKYIEVQFDLDIQGKSATLCPTKPKSSGGSGGAGPAAQPTEQLPTPPPATGLLTVKILEAPKNISAGGRLAIVAEVTNPNSPLNGQIYSYVYSGSKLASAGGWLANAQNLSMEAGTTKKIELANDIKPDAQLATHTLKVRLKADDLKIDAVQEIEVVAGSSLEITEEENTLNLNGDEHENSAVDISAAGSEKAKKVESMLTNPKTELYASKSNRNFKFGLALFAIAAAVLVLLALKSKIYNKVKKKAS